MGCIALFEAVASAFFLTKIVFFLTTQCSSPENPLADDIGQDS